VQVLVKADSARYGACALRAHRQYERTDSTSAQTVLCFAACSEAPRICSAAFDGTVVRVRSLRRASCSLLLSHPALLTLVRDFSLRTSTRFSAPSSTRCIRHEALLRLGSRDLRARERATRCLLTGTHNEPGSRSIVEILFNTPTLQVQTSGVVQTPAVGHDTAVYPSCGTATRAIFWRSTLLSYTSHHYRFDIPMPLLCVGYLRSQALYMAVRRILRGCSTSTVHDQ
jgi:hypothetical protein